jgi:thiol-disulfide isomerase/thioredoxin
MKPKLCFLLFLFLILEVMSYAQSGVDTLSQKDTIPFDRAFRLKIPGITENIVAADLFMLDRNGCLASIYSLGCSQRKMQRIRRSDKLELKKIIREIDSLKKNENVKKENDSLLKELEIYKSRLSHEIKSLYEYGYKFLGSAPVDVLGKDASNNLYLQLFPLEPASQYVLYLSEIGDTKKIEEIFNLMYKKETDSARNAYIEFTEKEHYVPPKIFATSCSECKKYFPPLGNFEDFKNFYHNEIEPLNENYQKSLLKFQILKDSLVIINKSYIINDSLIKTLLLVALNCHKCEDTIPEFLSVNKKYPQNLSEIIANYYLFQDSLMMIGITSMEGIDSLKITTQDNYPERFNNLNKSISFIRILKNFANYVKITSGNSDINNLISQMREIEIIYLGNASKLEKIVKSSQAVDKLKQELLDEARKFKAFKNPIRTITSGTYSFNFDVRASYSIQPDFGFLFYGDPVLNLPKGKNYMSFWGFSPFVGFHLNFRNYDTRVPYRLIRKRNILDRMSFTSGLTITSIEESGIREGLIGNLGLFTGFGFMLGHGVRISTGSMWFKRINPDPLISKRQIGATFYASLCLDLRLKNFMPNFISKAFPNEKY